MTHTHFIGIGGTGLSAIAMVLLERGETVSGSDRVLSPLAERVCKAGANVYEGHAAENVRGADVVVRSSAIAENNVEVVAAREAGIPVLRREEYLGQLLAGQFIVGIAGSHGKTTTTSMIAWMLHSLGLEPGFIVGGDVRDLQTNARAGAGEYFVIEADEYDYMFWGLSPTIAMVTNVEHDHPDCFPTPGDFAAAFRGYVDRITPDGTLVVCLDDPGAVELLEYAEGKDIHWQSYSLETLEANYAAKNLQSEPGQGYCFEAYRRETKLADVALQVPGQHNVQNALAALAVADLLNLDLKKAAQALGQFSGSGRRFEILGEVGGVLVVDDYGHHPTEIKATLSATRDHYPERKLWAVWQPHTYSRTQQLLDEFGACFSVADAVVVLGVYAAREAQPEGFKPQDIVDAIENENTHLVQELDAAADFLLEEVGPGDVVIVFSAGDATQVSAKMLAGLQAREGAG